MVNKLPPLSGPVDASGEPELPPFDDWASHIADETNLQSKSPSQIEYEILEGLQKAYRLGLGNRDRLIAEWRASADWMMGSSNPDEWQRGGSGYLRKCADELETAATAVPSPPAQEPMNEQAVKAALHASKARLYPDATYEKYLDELSVSLADLVGDAEPDSLDDAALRQAADAISHLRRTRDELRRDLNNVALAALQPHSHAQESK